MLQSMRRQGLARRPPRSIRRLKPIVAWESGRASNASGRTERTVCHG